MTLAAGYQHFADGPSFAEIVLRVRIPLLGCRSQLLQFFRIALFNCFIICQI